jgi:protein MpaA
MKKQLVLLILSFLIGGCAAPKKLPQGKLARAAKINHIAAGKSIQNRKIEYLKIGSGKNVIFYLAAIHGDEPQGTPLALKLAEYLQEDSQLLAGKKVIILPQANPDGVVLNQRFNARGIDLNRNFPAKNRENNAKYGFKALCEPESKIIYKIIKKYKPRIIVSLHQPSGKKPGWVDYDDLGTELAKKMSAACDMPIYKYGSMPGSLGSYASQNLNVPIITFEHPRNANATPEILWQKYGNALLTAVQLKIEK